MRPSLMSSAALETMPSSRSSAPTRGSAGPASVTSWPMLTMANEPDMCLPFRHRYVDAFFAGCLSREIVAGVNMPRDADAGVIVQHALDPASGVVGPVGDGDLPCMQRVAHAHAATMMEADPRCTGSRIEQRVENRPVGDGIGPIEHFLCFAIRAGDRAGIKMVAADGDRCRDFTFAHKLVDGEAHPGAFAAAEPADTRGQALKSETATSQFQPAGENLVFGKEFESKFVGAVDVFGISR